MREMYGREEMPAGGGGFAVGLIWGVAVGAAVALLIAPKTGRELRGQVSDSVDRLKGRARKGYDVARERYDRASDTMGDAVTRAGEFADSLSERASERASRYRGESRVS